MGRASAVAEAPREGRIKAEAYALGFDLCGITRLGVSRSREHFERWLSLGRAGEMAYMSRYREQRGDSRLVHPGAVSAIVVAMNYGGREPAGAVARYARGDDYHDLMRDRLRALLAWLEEEVGHALDARPYVDTAPILERDLAREAGLGWIGKNTNLINPRLGSYFFIGSLFVNLELAPDEPFEADRCGSCRRCIDACPTDAIVAPHELDARLCVSYLTIELRDEVPEELRSQMGELLYGCDICQ
ncbi:MAG: tRNA epoxyqueuosine(34) reductase QueG, partial [Gemmatimonadaceae bacterium]